MVVAGRSDSPRKGDTSPAKRFRNARIRVCQERAKFVEHKCVDVTYRTDIQTFLEGAEKQSRLGNILGLAAAALRSTIASGRWPRWPERHTAAPRREQMS